MGGIWKSILHKQIIEWINKLQIMTFMTKIIKRGSTYMYYLLD